ncbi:unnamed protein product [Amoebophrya sp. A120]|nr:unnamed protein product [Amoebophrya sp. A120]|eukprot:GSA120T00021495001.1
MCGIGAILEDWVEDSDPTSSSSVEEAIQQLKTVLASAEQTVAISGATEEAHAPGCKDDANHQKTQRERARSNGVAADESLPQRRQMKEASTDLGIITNEALDPNSSKKEALRSQFLRLLARRGPDHREMLRCDDSVTMLACVLHMRGPTLTPQPVFVGDAEDQLLGRRNSCSTVPVCTTRNKDGSWFAFNGEIFGLHDEAGEHQNEQQEMIPARKLKGATESTPSDVERGSAGAKINTLDATLFANEISDTTWLSKRIVELRNNVASDASSTTEEQKGRLFDELLQKQILERIQGPFAFLHYCERRQRLFCMRDGLGRRSLCVQVRTGRIGCSKYFDDLENIKCAGERTHDADTQGNTRMRTTILVGSVLPLPGDGASDKVLLHAEIPCSGALIIQNGKSHGINYAENNDSGHVVATKSTFENGNGKERLASPSPPFVPFEFRERFHPALSSPFHNLREALRTKSGSCCALPAPRPALSSDSASVRPRPTLSTRSPFQTAAARLETALRNAVRKRVQFHEEVTVLFSGGLDSTVLAALAADYVKKVRLVNVSYSPTNSPDRVTCLLSFRDLKARRNHDNPGAAGGKFDLVLMDLAEGDEEEDGRDLMTHKSSSSDLTCSVDDTRHVKALLGPSHNTHMDYNIGMCLWQAASRPDARGPPAPSSRKAEEEKKNTTRHCYSLPDSDELFPHWHTLFAQAAQLLPDEKRPGENARKEKLKERVLAEFPEAWPCYEQKMIDGGDNAPADLVVGASLTDEPTMLQPGARPEAAVRVTRDEHEDDPIATSGIDCSVYRDHWRLCDRGRRQPDTATRTAPESGTSRQEFQCHHEGKEDGSRINKVLLVGHGADELFGGYARHVSQFLTHGKRAMYDELRKDLERFWTRNLGRDDRVLADHGREPRHPFLDEDVVQLVSELVQENEVPAAGPDKMLLRYIADKVLKLPTCAKLDKRAIQFGSGLAKKSNRAKFGSSRKANGRAQFE